MIKKLFIIIGKSELLNTLVVVHGERSEAIQIISARTAISITKQMQEEYEPSKYVYTK